MSAPWSRLDDETVTVSFDEVTTIADVDELFAVLNGGSKPDFSAQSLADEVKPGVCLLLKQNFLQGFALLCR